MMSVISAQSTARNIPAEAPNSERPDERQGDMRPSAAIVDPHRADRAGGKMSGLRPIRSDSRDAGKIASTVVMTMTIRRTTLVLFASVFVIPKVRGGRSRRS